MSNERLVMTDIDLQESLKKSKYYRGFVMNDEIFRKINPNIQPSSYILNYDNSNMSGSHWVGLYIDNDTLEYFDSFGVPPLQNIIELAKEHKKKLIYNDKMLQPLESVICGQLSVTFVMMREKGLTYDQILESFNKYNFSR